ncbi:DinB family protein [Lysinibacillus telephonicus]|uniref:DinB family protein n=1 Tax=Lysinibacillus telephonicus TaxID=1714840 RepID=A0A3S0HKU1_9BACI|nr:DinB family protein [Lysinibacillus telephonicus]RTQ92735.1 DinB family protein [Lysinibacillus telephonicus]
MKQRHKVLFQQLESYRGNIINVLENITEEQSEIVPKGFNNNIRWNMGHILLDQYLWIEALTKEKSEVPEQFNYWFGFGTSPANFNADTPSFHELKELLKIQPAKIREAYSNRLEEEFPTVEMGMYTIEQVLIRTIFHEGMHLQAILDIKKFI